MADDLVPGTKLDHYEILEPIGKGGMGEVYRARDTKLGRDIAVKILREDLASDPERLRRFEQEARSASALNHPNIIRIYDVGEHKGVRYIAMEYVDARTLREVVRDGPLPSKSSFTSQLRGLDQHPGPRGAGLSNLSWTPVGPFFKID